MKPRYQTIISAYLSEDARLQNDPAAKRKIHADEAYEIHLLTFRGIPDQPAFPNDMVAALIRCKHEGIELIIRMGTYEPGDPENHLDQMLKLMEGRGLTPLLIVRDAKKWCRIPLSEAERQMLKDLGREAA